MQLFGVLLPSKEGLLRTAGEIIRGKAGIILYLSLIGLVVGGVGVGSIFILGHGHTTNTSTLVPWGLQISTYIFFALVSGGCIFTNFVGNYFYHDRYEPIASRVIFFGLITAIAGFASLGSELGHVERMYRFMISPNPRSPMFWMSVWYTADIVILFVEYINIQRGKHSRALLYASFVIPLITYTSLGSLFGAVGTMPYYYSSLLPIYFIIAGFLAGNSLSAIVASAHAIKTGDKAVLDPFFQMQKIALAAVFLLTLSRIVVGVSSDHAGYEVFRETFTQNVLFGMIGGMVVPYLIIMLSRTLGAMILSSSIIIFTQFMSRVDLVVQGFRVPVFRVYDMAPRSTYTPTIPELLVVVFSASLVAVLYIIGERTGLFDSKNGKEVA